MANCKNGLEAELLFSLFASILCTNCVICSLSLLGAAWQKTAPVVYFGKRRPVYGTYPFARRAGGSAAPLSQDAPLLLRWMTDPRVLAFYGGRDLRFTPEKVQEEFYTPEQGVRRCLVEFEGIPVGYIQIYPLDEELCREYHYPHRKEELAFGIDQFLGEPALWGKHIGRRFLSLVLRHLTQQEGAAAVIFGPSRRQFPGPALL